MSTPWEAFVLFEKLSKENRAVIIALIKALLQTQQPITASTTIDVVDFRQHT